MIKFNTTLEDSLFVDKIADRAGALLSNQDMSPSVYPRLDMLVDLTACNANGCPLDFQKLLDFPDFDFIHDIFGIRNNLNRSTGKLEDCFVPRCARRS